MKTLHKIIILMLSISTVSTISFSQNKDGAKALIDQGTALHDQGKYAEAIDKYKEAIRIDSGNYRAFYEMSFSLYVSGKTKEAIPYLEKLISSTTDYKAQACDLLGSIYDDDKQPDKAISYYKEGIDADPKYQRLHFNLGTSFLRQKKYNEAETELMEALKLDPKHASSHRLYAIASYYQNRNICAVLALSNFLLIEPQGQRAISVFKLLQQILQSQILKNDKGGVDITYTPGQGNDEFNTAELMIPLAAAATMQKTKDSTPYQLFELQLTSVISIAAELSEKKKDKSFFWKYYADYFSQLSKSGNMPAFVRLISQSGFQEENAEWLKENDDKLKALNAWVTATKREF